MSKIFEKGIIDAYTHVGNPKFGTLKNIYKFYETLNVKKGVLVLGPGIPDFDSQIKAKKERGNNIRFMGIPFGETEKQRLELGEKQIEMGISGMRLMPFELEPNKRLINRMGQEGLKLMAINPYNSKEATVFLLDWLDRYPEGKVTCPHFLIPETIEQRTEDPELFKKLLRHPNFYTIITRQGDVGSTLDYPYKDLLPWVEQLVENVTWDRMMWGSEFPVLYQRNENPQMVRNWMMDLGIDMTDQQIDDFYFNNAEKCFFSDEKDSNPAIDVPDWVDKQVKKEDDVYLFPKNRVFIPMDDYDTLLTDYIEKAKKTPKLMFADYVASVISDAASRIKNS